MTFVGTIEFKDLGSGELYLHTVSEHGDSYRLVVEENYDLFNFLKDSASAQNIVSVNADVKPDTLVTGGTHLAVLVVKSAE